MDSKRNGNLAKLVAFFLIVTVLVMAIAFSVSGWQDEDLPAQTNKNDPQDKTESGEKKEDTIDGNDPSMYTHYISGLEITKEQSLLKPLCIFYDSEAPIYGLSTAFMTVEIPTEGGKTRLLAFTNDATSLGKLGALAPARRYMINIATYFSAIPVHLGNDDSFGYSTVETRDTPIDLLPTSGYYYTEYGIYSYTNQDLLSAYIKNNGVNTVTGEKLSAPYVISPSGVAGTQTGARAHTVLVQFEKGSTTELIYSEESGKYKLQKNSVPIADKLNDTVLEYDNAFILYANATTYETAEATEMILDTIGGGSGYYINGGSAEKISWSVTDTGDLRFLSADGEVLSVSAGASYVAFAKASQTGATKLA